MFQIPNIYKNIIFVVFIIVFLFLHSNEKLFNQFFIEKKSLGYLFIFVIIYLIYHQFNLALLFIPFFMYQCIQHPQFYKKVLQNPKLQTFSQKINSFLIEIGIISKEEKKEEIEQEEEEEEFSQQENQEMEMDISKQKEKIDSQENIEMTLSPQIETIEYENDTNDKSTPIHSLSSSHENSQEKTLSMEELQELYLSIQEELQEIDKKNISI
jgi:hypothetical protein